jgi:hypothetical protein
MTSLAGIGRHREVRQLSADVYDRCLSRFWRHPGHWALERVVDLERRGRVSPEAQTSQQPLGQRVVGEHFGQ